MQTFLPYKDFERSARALDNRRAGKQRIETLQVLNTLFNPNAKGWRNHPAVKMWRGHEGALIRYGVAVCDVWIEKGYKDTCREKILAYAAQARHQEDPSWLGREDFHASHRANLLRKDFEHYSQHGWTEDPTMEYVWPVD